jgi:hypothetical protein
MTSRMSFTGLSVLTNQQTSDLIELVRALLHWHQAPQSHCTCRPGPG